MILNDEDILELIPISPFSYQHTMSGMSYGLGPASYDIRLGDSVEILPNSYTLGVAYEHIAMPNNITGSIKDKSSWIRRGLLVGNTHIDPGWRGYLTLELFNMTSAPIQIFSGDPIAQIVFYKMTKDALNPYNGKYQDQPNVPVEAKNG